MDTEVSQRRWGRWAELKAKVHGVYYRICNILSRYFLYSNDSNRMPMRRKLIRGMGWTGIWCATMVFVSGPVKPRRFRGEQSQNRRARHAQHQDQLDRTRHA
jgi:hypothetical protein